MFSHHPRTATAYALAVSLTASHLVVQAGEPQAVVQRFGDWTVTIQPGPAGSGVLDRDPIRQGANAAAVNGASGAFVRSAAIELPRGLRINVVSPGLLEESVKKYDGFFPGHEPVSSARVGLAYAKSVEGAITGQVIIVA